MNTPTKHRVRRATPDDADALARLRHAFRAERRPTVEDEAVFLARCTTWMRAHLGADAAWRAWILEVDGHAVGNIWLQVIEKLPNPGTEPETNGYVSSFYVHPDHRNGGAGSILLDVVLTHAKEAGVHLLYLWPTDRSRPLYARHGFTPATEILVQALWARE